MVAVKNSVEKLSSLVFPFKGGNKNTENHCIRFFKCIVIGTVV